MNVRLNAISMISVYSGWRYHRIIKCTEESTFWHFLSSLIKTSFKFHWHFDRLLCT